MIAVLACALALCDWSRAAHAVACMGGGESEIDSHTPTRPNVGLAPIARRRSCTIKLPQSG